MVESPQPDVTVVIAVYDTMPYLTACLESVAAQTIGLERLQVVAVDDGSTDGSGAELDRFAAEHPGAVTVVHQENSGGPAGPNNRALDLATGRFVFFLGADDHLGEEALERLVRTADEQDADVVFGRMVGANGRFVHQKIYRETDLDLDLYDSELPFAVANTKLFRRSLVEDHGLRYPEDLRIGSDQTFTIAALVHSRRTCVLADYVYYHAVRRDDASNISYHSTWQERLHGTGRIMDEVATHLGPGPQRDAVLRRHLTWELAKLLRADLLELDVAEQDELVESVAVLCDRYFSDALKEKMGVKRRIRLCLAEARRTDLLRELLVQECDHGDPPFLVERGRTFAGYPGHDGTRGVPREWCEVFDESVAGRLTTGILLTRASLTGDGLALEGSVQVAPADRVDGVFVRAVEQRKSGGAKRIRIGKNPPPSDEVATHLDPRTSPARGLVTSFTALVRPTDLTSGEHVAPRLRVRVAGSTYDLPLPVGDLELPSGTTLRRGLVRSRVDAVADDAGHLVVGSSTLGWWPSPRRATDPSSRSR